MKRQILKSSGNLKKCLGNVVCKENTRLLTTSNMRCTEKIPWEKAKPFHEIPSSFMLPFIGTAWQTMPLIGPYKRDRQHLANIDRRARLGDIVREKFGPLNAIICYSVEDLETIHRKEGKLPIRTPFATIQKYRESRKQWFSTTGLLVLQGKEWYDLRSKTQKHLLKPLAILDYADQMQDVGKEFNQRIFDVRDANNEVPQLLEELYKWALESVSLVGLDTRLGCLRSNLEPDSDGMKMIESVLEQFDCMNKLEAFAGNLEFWKLFRTPTWRKFEKASDVYSEISFKYINKAVDDLKHLQADPDKKLTLLQSMLATKDLSVSDAMVFVADMLMAGIETTSHTMAFLLYHLAKNPEKQENLFKELKELLPTEGDKFTPAVYESLKYTKACIKESMRLNAVIGGSARQLVEDAVLSGYQVPAGTMVFVSYEEIFVNEKHFKNAESFVPERWLNRDERHLPFSFIPFGFGPRSCIGRRLAELEMIALISQIVRKFRLEYHFDDIGYFSRMVNVPDKPLRFNFIER